MRLIIPLLAAAALLPAGRAEEPRFALPDGFVIERAELGEVQYPMFAAFDDSGRLYVTESSGRDLYAELQAQTRFCRVSRLEDADGDGVFESQRIFADQLVYPMGVAWREGKLYIPDPPNLLALEDRDDDGRADSREVILSGFGHQDNGSLHGLTFGPDGWLYMTMGAPDGYKLRNRNGTVLSGRSGALIRCSPGGGSVEIICRGFENLIEVVWMPGGEMVGTVNWFQRPTDGLRDALVHLVPGGLYPLNLRDEGTAFPRTGVVLPSINRVPAVAYSGLCRYEGGNFPPEMRGSLFVAEHNTRKVSRHVLTRNGATFRSEEFAFLASSDPDFHPSDVLEAPDGSLLVVDTGGWYVQHCPTGKIRQSASRGGIYRIRHAATPLHDDPPGGKIEWAKLNLSELAALFGDPRFLVRERASRELVERKSFLTPVVDFVKQSGDANARDLAMWTLGRIKPVGATKLIESLLQDHETEVVSGAIRWLERSTNIDSLEPLLAHANEQIRMQAAFGLPQTYPIGRDQNLPKLWQAFQSAEDPFLEHALVYSLWRLASTNSFAERMESKDPRMAKAALVLLDQKAPSLLEPEPVLRLLGSEDFALRETVLGLLETRPAWLPVAEPHLETLLQPDAAATLASPFVERFPNSGAVRRAAARLLQADATPSAIRLELLRSIRKTGALRPPAEYQPVFRALLNPASANPESQALQAEAIHAASALNWTEFSPEIRAAADRENLPEALRVPALAFAGRGGEAWASGHFALLLRVLREGVDPGLRRRAAELLGESSPAPAQQRALLGAAAGLEVIYLGPLIPALLSAPAEEDAAWSLIESRIGQGWEPPLADFEKWTRPPLGALPEKAARLTETLRARQNSRAEKLAALEPLLAGGKAGSGREVFFSPAAACAACHRVQGEGGMVGPDLSHIGAIRSGRDLLESIVYPSSTLAQGYQAASLILKDGTELSGIIAGQFPEHLLLRQASGQEARVSRSDIVTQTARENSLMPDGFDAALNREQFRDLLAFLQALK